MEADNVSSKRACRPLAKASRLVQYAKKALCVRETLVLFLCSAMLMDIRRKIRYTEVGLQAFFIAPGNAIMNRDDWYTIDLYTTGPALPPSAHIP